MLKHFKKQADAKATTLSSTTAVKEVPPLTAFRKNLFTNQIKNFKPNCNLSPDLSKISNIELPDKDDNRLTVFFPIEDFLAYTVQTSAAEQNRDLADYDFRLEIPESKSFLNVYLRPNYDIFIDFLAEITEPVVYSTCEPQHINRLLVAF